MSTVLGLRYFACEACGTVYASPDEPSDCDRCDRGRLADVLCDGTYFAPVE